MSSAGTPSISAITVTGIGKANPSIRSNLSLPSKVVQEIIDNALDSRMKFGYRPRRECLRDEGSQPRVVRRVVVEHAPVLVLLPIVLGKTLMVTQHCVHIFVTRQHPGVNQSHPVNGVFGAQEIVSVVRVVLDAGGSWIVVDARLHPLPCKQRRSQCRPKGPFYSPGNNCHDENLQAKMSASV